MSALLKIDKYPETKQLMAAMNEQFSQGAETVDLVEGSKIIGTILSREAAQKALARKVAEQWLAHPDFLSELETSLEEKPENWD